MKFLSSTVRPGLSLAGFLLLFQLAAAGQDPRFSPFPGIPQGSAEASWYAPYVLFNACSFPGPGGHARLQQVVRWYDDRGNILKEISGSLYLASDFIEQLTAKKEIFHGLSGRWKVTLPRNPTSVPPSGWIIAKGDTLIQTRNIDMGRTMVDVYSSGKLAGSAGPFLIRQDEPQFSDDGCTTLMTWKDEKEKIPQVITIGPDAKIRLEIDCGQDTGLPFPLAGGNGVLFTLHTNDRLPISYDYLGANGLRFVLDKLPDASPVECLLSGDLVLFFGSSQPERLKLVHAATGEIVWDILFPLRRSPTNGLQATVAGDKILLLGLDVAALDAKSGKLLRVWKSEWKQGLSAAPRGRFFRKGDDIYIVTDKEFFKLDLRDPELKIHGWE